MNKIRRFEILNIEKSLQDIVDRIESVKEDEEDTKSNLEEYPQFENKVIDSEMSIDALEESLTSINDAISSLTESRTI